MLPTVRRFTDASPRDEMLEIGGGAGAAFTKEVTLPTVANRIYDWLMRIDEFALRRGFSLPFGGSLLVVPRRT